MEVEGQTIREIWQALQRPEPPDRPFPVSLATRITEAGWASTADIEDLLLMLDRRSDPPAVIDIEKFAATLNLPFRAAFSRPKYRLDDCFGHSMLSAIDAAAFCIFIERLGFRIDLTTLCARLKGAIPPVSHLCEDEISVLFYDQNRHRMPPVTLSAPHRPWRGMRTMRHKTGSGYRLEYVIDDDGEPLWLKIVAPKYRKRPETQSVTCPDCGMLYVKGLRTDEQVHRSFHRKRFAIIDPKPNRQFADALSRDLDAPWVDVSSPKWKRKAVYDRALEFKRELGYDFVQWQTDPDYDSEAVGFLFSDDEDRIVGACAFRPQPAGRGKNPWRLDWIWMCPDARRRGLLGHQWDRFRQRFGVFDIEPPISEAMQAFLRKRGCAGLIR